MCTGPRYPQVIHRLWTVRAQVHPHPMGGYPQKYPQVLMVCVWYPCASVLKVFGWSRPGFPQVLSSDETRGGVVVPWAHRVFLLTMSELCCVLCDVSRQCWLS